MPRESAKRGMVFVVEAKGKKGMAARQYQRTPYLHPYGQSGGTTAKIMVAAKDNLLGKYIYKDTIARNIAAVIYRDEKEIQKTAIKQHRVLRTATEFPYGYKLVVLLSVFSVASSSVFFSFYKL
ncbi:hypothetical protein DY000_02062998 [Brassica cretica]|uniref:Uncharacterized protein n=1 Tax=Brassica cretica TaxID=69181 RepID=A0ABQ7B075_BRACR|nr:hypothetical protein DY000_02062998 [Brassica cretica]